MYDFVVNLKPYTFHLGRGNRRYDRFLISTDYDENHRALIRKVHGAQRALVADNGNFDLIGDLVEQFRPEVDALHDRRRQEAQQIGHYLRPGDISSDLRRSFLDAAARVAQATRELNQPDRLRQINAEQEKLKPSYRIGPEDLTLAVLSGLRIEPVYLGWSGTHTTPFTQAALNGAGRVESGEFGPVTGDVFAGLHGMDFDTALAAGQLAAKAGIGALASGLGAPLSDNGYTDFVVIEGRAEILPFKVPRAYVRVAEIISGMFAGYREVRGQFPDFHALGVGTPIILALMGRLATPNARLFVDSTAPIKDATVSRTISLYVHQPAPLKLKAHRIIEYWLKDVANWDPVSSRSRRFNEIHPPRIDQARAWWESVGRRRLVASDLATGSVLSECFPLLGRPADDALREEAGVARTHHNHWTIQQIVEGVNQRIHDPAALADHVNSLVDAYGTVQHADSRWQRAVFVAWQIIDAVAAAKNPEF